MKLTVLGVVIAEGSEAECALYTGMLLDILRQVGENIKKQEVSKELEAFRKLLNKPLDELIKSEREEDE